MTFRISNGNSAQKAPVSVEVALTYAGGTFRLPLTLAEAGSGTVTVDSGKELTAFAGLAHQSQFTYRWDSASGLLTFDGDMPQTSLSVTMTSAAIDLANNDAQASSNGSVNLVGIQRTLPKDIIAAELNVTQTPLGYAVLGGEPVMNGEVESWFENWYNERNQTLPGLTLTTYQTYQNEAYRAPVSIHYTLEGFTELNGNGEPEGTATLINSGSYDIAERAKNNWTAVLHDLQAQTAAPDTVYRLTVWTEDAAGNRSDETATRTIYVDRTSPASVTITDVEPFSELNRVLNNLFELATFGLFFNENPERILTFGSDSLLSGEKRMAYQRIGTVRRDGATVQLNGIYSAVEESQWTDMPADHTIPIPLGFRGYVAIRVEDNAGNDAVYLMTDGIIDEISKPNQAEIVFEGVYTDGGDYRPLPSKTPEGAQTLLWKNAQDSWYAEHPYFTITASDNATDAHQSGIAYIEVYEGDALVERYDADTLKTEAGSEIDDDTGTLSSTRFTHVSRTDGEFTVHVRVYDLAGNYTDSAAAVNYLDGGSTFRVDTMTPELIVVDALGVYESRIRTAEDQPVWTKDNITLNLSVKEGSFRSPVQIQTQRVLDPGADFLYLPSDAGQWDILSDSAAATMQFTAATGFIHENYSYRAISASGRSSATSGENSQNWEICIQKTKYDADTEGLVTFKDLNGNQLFGVRVMQLTADDDLPAMGVARRRRSCPRLPRRRAATGTAICSRSECPRHTGRQMTARATMANRPQTNGRRRGCI